MLLRRLPLALLVFSLISFGLSSCTVRRTRSIPRVAGKSKQALMTADKATLLGEVAKQYQSIRDVNASVDMTPALGSAENNKITEYKDVRAYILFRKPDDIRLIGLYPVVRATAFDMVSDGSQFKLYIPSKDRFLVGKNEIQQPSANKLENLRPQHFLEAMLVRPMPNPDRVLLQNFTDEENAYYILEEVENGPKGGLLLRRSIWFDRSNMTMARQIIFDDSGNILTDAHYDRWQAFDNIPFPRHIEINRPRDEYGVVIDVVKIDVNKGITDDKFVLDQPEGSKLQVVGEAPAAPPPGSTQPKRK